MKVNHLQPNHHKHQMEMNSKICQKTKYQMLQKKLIKRRLSLSNSIDAVEKNNPDGEDFEPGTPSISDNDDEMESDKNVPRGHKRKNQG